MRVRTLVAGGALAAGAALAVAPVSPAFAVCDSYSAGCSTPPPEDPPTPPKPPKELPFTGGEVVLMSAVGAGALAGGTALVVAGRRRKSPAA